MVKKLLAKPSEIKNVSSPPKFVFTKTGGKTQTGKVIRNNNRAVPLNPKQSRNKPRAGNFGTKRRIQ